ncbi:MAG: hypothetical protein HYU63_07390 [Armatimonadetes bacterium]|nr:hypothetical protein [Armatimonadota bacterium]
MKISKDKPGYNLFKKLKFLKNKTIQPKRYLNIFWNQHQPYYKDEAEDCFVQPWVRLHACKDYYDMAEILEKYPNVHVTINLSASLLRQLDEYLEKLYDFADISSAKRGDLKYYPYGKVDSYLDLTLKPVEEWTKEDKEFALKNFFNADYKAQIQIFPGYKYLYDKKNKGLSFTLEDFRDLKVWFNLSWMDYSFQSGDVLLKGIDLNGSPLKPQEWVKDTDDLVKKGIQAGYSNARFTEIEAKNLILDQYKIMKYVVPIHRYLMRRKSPDGYPQIEVVTTPFYHPILPLINDLNTAKEADPDISLPEEKFSAPEDAFAQVVKGGEYYKQKFGSFPQGMWPGEGAVAENIIPAFQKNQIRWIASGDETAFHSGHVGDNGLIYRIDNDHEFIDHDGSNGQTNNSDAMSIVFRSIHDKIGFDYGVYQDKIDGKAAAEDFLDDVKNYKHFNNVPQDEDILITNLADGENTWINYLHDGKEFLEALYGKLNENKEIITATPSIFIDNHPIDKQWELEPLAAGTWVNGSFKKWLGKDSKNEAWRRLKIARDALINARIPQSDPYLSCPLPSLDRKGYFIWKACMFLLKKPDLTQLIPLS